MNTTLACDAMVYRLGGAATLSASNGTISAWSTVSSGGYLTSPVATVGALTLYPLTTLRGDLTLSLQHDDEEVNLKGRRTKAHVATLEDCQIETMILHDTTNFHWQALAAAKINRTTVPMLFLSNDIATVGAEGVYADFAVLDFSREEVINGILVNKVTFAYGLSDTEPQQVKIIA